MKCVWNMLFVFYLILFQSTHSVSIRTVNDEKKIPVTADILPILTNMTSINSTAIEYTWHPSPSLEGIDLDQLDGVFTDGVYAGSQEYTSSLAIIYDMNKLNETGQKFISNLKADTVYHVCYQSKWYKQNTTLNPFSLDGLYRRECGLLRTYMEGEQTK